MIKSRSLIILSLAILLPCACRIAKTGKDMPSDQTSPQGASDSTAHAPVVQPQRQASKVFQAIPVSLDERGIEKGRTVLRLDYLPPAKPGSITMPSCYESILPHLVLGKIVCGSNQDLVADVTAGQLDQICYTNSKVPRIERKSPIQLAACFGPSTLQIYSFSPEMKVEVQN